MPHLFCDFVRFLRAPIIAIIASTANMQALQFEISEVRLVAVNASVSSQQDEHK